MEVLRIKLKQNQAHYRREESITNKMTYPLPPFSTVIGALHKACGFTSYQPMNISIQGSYQSLRREAYTDYAFLNSVMDDRGILVYLQNSQLLSSAYTVVAKAKKTQGNSFREGKTIDVVHESLLADYRRLKDLRDEFDHRRKNELEPALAVLDQEQKALNQQLKACEDKKSPTYIQLKAQIDEIKGKKKSLKEAFEQEKENQVEEPYSHFASLTTSLRYYEVLYGVELVLHIDSDPEILETILQHIPDLTAIGRSEDFVEVTEARMVEVSGEITDQMHSSYSAYLPLKLAQDGCFMTKFREGVPATGTVYDLNKNYVIRDKRRIFEKKSVLYCQDFWVDEESQGVKVDTDGYLVNLI